MSNNTQIHNSHIGFNSNDWKIYSYCFEYKWQEDCGHCKYTGLENLSSKQGTKEIVGFYLRNVNKMDHVIFCARQCCIKLFNGEHKLIKSFGHYHEHTMAINNSRMPRASFRLAIDSEAIKSNKFTSYYGRRQITENIVKINKKVFNFFKSVQSSAWDDNYRPSNWVSSTWLSSLELLGQSDKVEINNSGNSDNQPNVSPHVPVMPSTTPFLNHSLPINESELEELKTMSISELMKRRLPQVPQRFAPY